MCGERTEPFSPITVPDAVSMCVYVRVCVCVLADFAQQSHDLVKFNAGPEGKRRGYSLVAPTEHAGRPVHTSEPPALLRTVSACPAGRTGRAVGSLPTAAALWGAGDGAAPPPPAGTPAPRPLSWPSLRARTPARKDNTPGGTVTFK